MSDSKKEDTDLDEEAARRALDYYLNPTPSKPDLERSLWTLREGVSNAQASEHAMALLRCAAATAQETGSHLQGTTREVVFALMHMMNMARALLEQCHATEKAGNR
ncbi:MULTISPECIES: DUF6124 family protein [Pseudomonas]|uniref:DUF3077 domain-containing protein n=1 Tax=Pseudomonas muyukensis TaxID=2842357 RepID=A0ABX8MGX9_9PSED|nr:MULTISPECIES: hypothetical protein [Pseudomonas]MCO7520717.1 hypothetical protein [Pseudomonas sp. 1]MCO7540303.1 hypothetical protein [Pseudomonas sp. VA159-2]QXH37494.1 hypothetical protein KSS95_11975 [Pseudomonas muyukensis]